MICIYEVLAIPEQSLLDKNSIGAIEKVYLSFSRAIEQYALLNDKERSSIRLVFANRNDECRIYIIFYCNTKQSAEQFVFHLVQLSYRIEELNEEEKKNVLDYLTIKFKNNMYAILKTELTVTSQHSALGYYYYTDMLQHSSGQTLDNYSMLLKVINTMPGSVVALDLIPTYFLPEEDYAIRDLSVSLEQLDKGQYFGNQFIKDPVAHIPLNCYTQHNKALGSPIYLFNILISAESEPALLATQVMNVLKFSSSQPANIEMVNIFDSSTLISGDSGTPFVINQHLMNNYRNLAIWNALIPPNTLFRLPFLMTLEEVCTFFRLPSNDGSISEIKSISAKQYAEKIDDEAFAEGNIFFGKLLENDRILGASAKAFTKHALVVGTPGSGKTTFSVNLLLQFARKGIPFLAIEPTKTEYRAMIDTIPNLQIFTPGNNSVSPYIINPFMPPRGIRVEQYIPSLASAFKAAFSMPSPLDMIFLKAIRTCYIKYGWKDYSKLGDDDVTLFGIHEFILEFKQLLENTNYSKEVRGNLESAGLLRLTNLIEQNSNIYDTINTVPIEDLLTAPTVLELNSIDNAEQKSLIMALLLINICIYTKHNQVGDGELKNAILIDEAHVLLGGGATASADGSPDSQATTIKALQDMIAEIRSYGTSIIIADQSPTKVSREVVANTDIKVSFRLVQSVEKELIADSTNMDEDALSNLSRLKPGEAYVYYSKLDTPQMVMTEDIREKEGIRLNVPDSEVAERSTYWNGHAELLKPYPECSMCHLCEQSCDFNIRSNAEFVTNSAFNKYRSSIKDTDTFKKCIFHLPQLMQNEMSSFSGNDLRKIQICSRIKLLRKIDLELPVSMSSEDKKKVITRFPKESEN